MTQALAAGWSSQRVMATIFVSFALLSLSGEARPAAAHDDGGSRGRLLIESCDTFCSDKAGVYANPCDPTCSTFFNCDRRVTAPTSCGSGLKFNPTYKVCDWPQNVVCDVVPSSSSPPPPPTTIQPTPTTSNPPPPPPSVPGGAVFFGPYKDVTINMDWNTYVISSSITGTRLPVTDSRVMPSNLRVLTWSFATGTCGSETWAGVTAASLVSANVKAFVDAGKQYIIATGGAAGVFRCDTDSGFTSFIQRYSSSALVGIDFDIEGGQSQADIESLVARVKAARGGPYGNLRYSFTLATLGGASGNQLNQLGTWTLNALKNAQMGWNNIFINLMVMDYGGACTVFNGGVCDMGQSAINAARALNSYWGVPFSSIELTPMIGGNDSPGQTFTLADVTTVSTFVKQSGLGGVHFWSLDRDVDCPPGAASATCNSYGQAGTLGFTKAFLSELGSPTLGDSSLQPPLPSGGGGSGQHTIMPDDTQSQVYGTTVGILEPLNPGMVSTTVQLNQVINMNCGDKNGPAPSSPVMAVSRESCQYTIKAGDTLWTLSQTYGTSVSTLESLNPGIVATALRVGQVINVPCGGSNGPVVGLPLTGGSGSCQYTIKAGDTLWGISQAYGTSVSTLESLNPGIVATALQVGQVINVPCGDNNGPAPNPGGGGSCQYTIKAGDTLWAISQAYGTSVSTLESLNSGIVATALQVGQVINVPCNGPTPSGPVPSPSTGTVLYSGSGSGTYYFDVRNNYCPQDPGGYPENNGYPACASYTPGTATYKTLAQLGSNNVVAIDNGVLSTNRAGLCGKKVLVYNNGVPVAAPDGGDFFVWDGCAACAGGVRLDFSVSGLQRADPNACTLGVVPGITWQVVDEVVQQFIP